LRAAQTFCDALSLTTFAAHEQARLAASSVHQVDQERRKQNCEQGPRPIETDDEREQQHNDDEAHRDLSSALFVLSNNQEGGE
jgi:hypothetical protein